MGRDTDSTGNRYLSDVLSDAGILSDSGEAEEIALSDRFQTQWRREIKSNQGNRSPREGLSEYLAASESEVAFENIGDDFEIRIEDRAVTKWESDAALVADVSAMAVLSERYGEWSKLSDPVRLKVAQALRTFLERCPRCDGSVTLSREKLEFVTDAPGEAVTVTDGPGEDSDVAETYAKLSCDDCGVRLLEIQLP